VAGDEALGLPGWALVYLPDFQRILHAIQMSESFVLFPIEVPGQDIAQQLAHFLDVKGFRCLVVDPTKSTWTWPDLVGVLLDLPVASDDVVMVIGDGSDDKWLHDGLRLLNQRRDSIARALARPLLWCGPRSFLDVTWQLAPDFWSVADVPRRIAFKAMSKPKPRVSSVLGFGNVGAKASPEDEAIRLHETALFQGDHANAMRIGIGVVEEAIARSHFTKARAWMTKLRAALPECKDPSLIARAHLLFGKLSLLLGTFHEAEADLSKVAALCTTTGNRELAADAMLTIGNVHVALHQFDEAKEAFDAALAFYTSQPGYDRRCGDVFISLGDLGAERGDIEQAEARYSAALAAYRMAPGNPLSAIGEANAVLALGELFARTHRRREAEALYDEAYALFLKLGVPLGQANTQVALGRLYADLERFDEAREAYESALKTLRTLDVPAWTEAVAAEFEALNVR